jgi:hypothetical protein
MGSITLLDVAGSVILTGFLLIVIYHTNARMNETEFTSGNDLVVQENLVSLSNIIERDFRRMGYCANQSRIPDPSKAILSATAHNITFLSDLGDDGNVDTIQYAIGTTSALTFTPNPRDVPLYRIVNNKNRGGFSLGVTKFDFTYYDVDDSTMVLPITDLMDIHKIQLQMQLESTDPYDTTYEYSVSRSLSLETRNIRGR